MLIAYVLTRTILVAAVMLMMQFAYREVYSVAAIFALSLLIYAYLLVWGHSPVENRLG